MKTQYWISFILIMLFTISIVPITAENHNLIGKDWSGDNIGHCKDGFGYPACQRIEMLIEEQNHTNYLLAYNYCKGTPTILTLDHDPTQQEMEKIKNSGEYKDNPFQDCVNKVIGDTK